MKIKKIDAQPKEIKKLRVAAYCRVSTESDDQRESLEAQKAHYESWIKLHNNWENAGIFYDFGISGTKADSRDGLQALMYECRIGRVDYVLTKSVSRFSRNTADCLSLVRELLSYNIPIYFEKENLDTGSMESELILAILSSMAQSESESISQNVKWGIRKRIKNGTFKLGYQPYGYMCDDNGDVVINPTEVDIVRLIYTSALSGMGAYKIAQLLESRKIPTRKGGNWSPATIIDILTNEKYYGAALLQKTYTDSNFKRHVNNGELEKNLILDHHEPIISKADFDKVQELMKLHIDERGIAPGETKYLNRYAFSSKIICGECGSAFKRQTQEVGIAWCCKTHLAHKDQCSIKAIKDEALKAAFVNMVNKLVFGYKLILVPYYEHLLLAQTDENHQGIIELKHKIQKNLDRKNDLRKLRVDGFIDNAMYVQEIGKIEKQNEDFRTMLRNCDRAVADREISEAKKLIAFLESAEMFSEFQDDIFTEYVDKIIVYSRTSIGFKLKCGLTLKEDLCLGTR